MGRYNKVLKQRKYLKNQDGCNQQNCTSGKIFEMFLVKQKLRKLGEGAEYNFAGSVLFLDPRKRS